MKIIKYVFLLLLLSAIAVTVFIATQEGKYDIKEERVIKVPKTVLFNYINEYRNWENVGILTANDTTAFCIIESFSASLTVWILPSPSSFFQAICAPSPKVFSE